MDCHNQSTATTAPINPVALRLLQLKNPDGSYYIPNPQTILTSGANAGLGFSSYSLPSTYKENQALVNADYLLSPKNTLGRADIWRPSISSGRSALRKAIRARPWCRARARRRRWERGTTWPA